MTVQQLFTSAPLTFESTVPRAFVHRRSVAEVLLTDSTQLDPADRFLLAAQWPRAHAYFQPRAGRHHTMLFTETVRQAAIFLAHKYFGVPLGHRFVMGEIGARVDTAALATATGTDVVVEATVGDRIHRDGNLAKYAVALTFRIDDREVGTGSGTAQVLPPAVYDLARWRTRDSDAIGSPVLGEPVSHLAVGEPNSTNVVLSPGEHWLELRIDERHHIFFDHPCDHVPGMLMLEAVAQAGRVLLGLPDAHVAELRATFRRFGEPDVPVAVVGTSLNSGDRPDAAVVFKQDGFDIASGTVTFQLD